MTALIILTYNNVECMRECLASARVLDAGRIVPIVVDNGSLPEVAPSIIEAVARAWGGEPQVVTADGLDSTRVRACPTVVRSEQNLGYARGNNLGLDVASAMPGVEYVLIANDDVMYVDDIVPGLQSMLCCDDNCGVATPVLYRTGLRDVDYNCARREEKVSEMIADNMLMYWWRWRGLRQSPRQRARFVLANISRAEWPERLIVDLPSGACMMMRTSVLDSVGRFDPHTFLYYEENILMAKLRRMGMCAMVDTRLKAVHMGAATTSVADRKYAMMLHSGRSQMWYVAHYSGASTLMRWMHRMSVFFMLGSHRLQQAIAPGFMKSRAKR